LIVFVALILSCGTEPRYTGYWEVRNGTAIQQKQADDLVTATIYVTGDSTNNLHRGGIISIHRDESLIAHNCGTQYASGCYWPPAGIAILIAPQYGLTEDLSTTALAHELCHAAGKTEGAEVEACSGQVIIEYNR
jgi:hypothetical protein